MIYKLIFVLGLLIGVRGGPTGSADTCTRTETVIGPTSLSELVKKCNLKSLEELIAYNPDLQVDIDQPDATLSISSICCQGTCNTNCGEILDPQCSQDGNIFRNHCEHEWSDCMNGVKTEVAPCKDRGSQRVHGNFFALPLVPRAFHVPWFNCPLACPTIYQPVLASNGLVYANMCFLQRAACSFPFNQIWFVRWHIHRRTGRRGMAGETQAAPLPNCLTNDAPVCGSDDVTYINQCRLENEAQLNPSKNLTVKYSGPCIRPLISQCNPVCMVSDAPVCGTDGVVYPNQCILDWSACVNTDTKIGVSEEPICFADEVFHCDWNCPDTLAPVCGSNHVTYRNRCFLLKEACKRPLAAITTSYLGYCRRVTSRPTCNIDCPTELVQPVCGSDGVSYSSKCHLDLEACQSPEKDLKLVSNDSCVKSAKEAEFHCSDMACPGIYEPVCGSNNMTYINQCHLVNHICKDPASKIVTQSFSACGEPSRNSQSLLGLLTIVGLAKKKVVGSTLIAAKLLLKAKTALLIG